MIDEVIKDLKTAGRMVAALATVSASVTLFWYGLNDILAMVRLW